MQRKFENIIEIVYPIDDIITRFNHFCASVIFNDSALFARIFFMHVIIWPFKVLAISFLALCH